MIGRRSAALDALYDGVVKRKGAMNIMTDAGFVFLAQIQVWKQRFWMKHYKSPTAKSTLLWSNSAVVSRFDLGPLSRSQLRSSVRTTDRWVNAAGRKCFKGNKNLRATQPLDPNNTDLLS
ncbi:unnamed protein product [Symbiodinium sp. KB8]|nr:unnamed protein product [Symbiodinium sp. KB8]